MNKNIDRSSILQMARGAFQERVDYEMGRVVDNILDLNTKATAKRKITLTIELTPDDERQTISVAVQAKATLAPTNPVATALCITSDGNGEMVVAEMVPQIPGQINMDGTQQEAPKILKLVQTANSEKEDNTMLAKMIDKIVALKETKTFEIAGQTYADAPLTRIPPHVDRPDCISVSGLDGICKLIRTELAKINTVIMVQAKSYKSVEVLTTYLPDFSRNILYRAEADVPGLRTGFRSREVALIELRSLFIPNEGTAYLLDLLSRMTDENSVSTKDNGVTQTVEARQGVALNALVEVKPRIQLQPFRTFLEVPQPESEFLLRVDPNEGIGFFEADGGVWKLEAKRNIADYFEKNLKDLIEAGKVVVMK